MTILISLVPATVIVSIFLVAIAASGATGALLAVAPLIVVFIGLVARALYAFNLETFEDRIVYRTEFQTRTWNRADVVRASRSSATTGLRDFVIPRLELKGGQAVNLRIFSSPLSSGKPIENSRSYRDVVQIIEAIDAWAASPGDGD